MKKFILPVIVALFMVIMGVTASFAKNACETRCQNCAKTCETTAKKLSHKKGSEALVKQLKDCAEKCKGIANGGKEFQACADACKACAEACEKSGDAATKECAKACQECSDCCGS